MARPAVDTLDRQRIFDVALTVPGLIALAPFLFLIGLAIRVVDGSPVLFRHTRIGKDFEPFDMIKFRTMSNRDRPDTDLNLSALDDPRITRLGSLLRSLKIDELPQLLNVLHGTMSLVGPRPEVHEYVQVEPEAYARLLTRRPGIADPAAIEYRDEDAVLAQYPAHDRDRAYIQEVLPQKLAISLAYHDQRTLRSDIGVLFRTVGQSFKKEKAQ